MATYQKRYPPRRLRVQRCRGAVTVELAIVAPLLFSLILCTVDIGQYIIVAQTVSNTSREAARFAARHHTASVTDVENAATGYVSNILPQANVNVAVRDANGNNVVTGGLADIPTGSPFSVEVTCTYDTMRWIDILPLPNSGTLVTTTTVRRE